MKQQNKQSRKPFLLISDFDGTISKLDFFQQILNHYFLEGENGDYLAYREKRISSFTLLSSIFQNIGLSESELETEIQRIPIDDTFTETARWILQRGGDICILSAGCDYYIKRRLRLEGLGEIPVVSNRGIYSDGGICMLRDTDSPWYSEESGIDKGKATAHFKKNYDLVAYAGDGTFDVPAAKLVNLRFAKRQLEVLLQREQIAYYPLTGFYVIRQVLEEQKIL